MKISQLKEVIRTKVREATAVKVTGGAALTDPQISQKITQMRTTTGDQTIGTEKNPIKFVKETEEDIKPGEYTVARLQKMGRSGLIDFLGLTREEARNWSDRQLQGAALEMADDRSDYEETVDEADYIDDDDTVHEGVDDDNTDFKDYDSIYEDMEDTSPNVDKYKLGEIERNDEFRANVGSGHRGVSVKSHPMDPRLIIISQDNGQRVVVEVEDINNLINVLQDLT
jgi:hypothetical protein